MTFFTILYQALAKFIAVFKNISCYALGQVSFSDVWTWFIKCSVANGAELSGQFDGKV
jgi:hypothetical protein